MKHYLAIVLCVFTATGCSTTYANKAECERAMHMDRGSTLGFMAGTAFGSGAGEAAAMIGGSLIGAGVGYYSFDEARAYANNDNRPYELGSLSGCQPVQ